MVGSSIRLAAVAAFSAALAGCADVPDYETPGGYGGMAVQSPSTPQQCVPYARERSHIAIYGDANTWWQQAEGRFERSHEPRTGAVLVLYNYAGPERGHLAVVTRIDDSRDIRVDHANWLDDGDIYRDDPVHDVSAANDWSEVRVYNLRTGAWGVRVYPVQGFIGPGPDKGAPPVAPPPPDEIAGLLAADGLPPSGKNITKTAD